MKLATLNDGALDRQLSVVAHELTNVHIADSIVRTLQAALAAWNFVVRQLAALYTELNAGNARRSFEFDPGRCMAPLPRVYETGRRYYWRRRWQ